MDTLLSIIIATIGISLLSLSGAILFIVKENKLKKYMILFVAIAAGSLLGTAFFHLIPEAVEMHFESEHLVENELQIDGEQNHVFLPSYFILFGILIFYIIEKFIHWHHHHDLDCHKHSLSTLSLVGDFVHNFLDGALIAAAFIADFRLGFVTTITIALHELPQEIGDLSILLHSGYSKSKALLFNFLSSLSAIIGAILMFFFARALESSLSLIVSFIAGTFIYLSLADIIPELNKKTHKSPQWLISLLFLFGISLSYFMSLVGH